MNSEKNWLLYYKHSLFDSENLAIDISRIKHLYHQNSSNIINALISTKNAFEILELEEKRINRLKGISKKDSTRWQKINETQILISPFHLKYETENSRLKQKTIHPFWIAATLDRSGKLSAPKDLFPLIVRNYLTPIADIKNDFIFSSIENVTNARNLEQPKGDENDNPINWNVYWDYINHIFNEVTFNSISHYRAEKYTTHHSLTYFAISSKISTAKSILFLYENLLDHLDELPLLSKIVTPADRYRTSPITDEGYLHYNHLHLGQMSNEFPLSISQRKTLLSYLTAEENPIIAVNGPPGTGKTTLLQSIVATEFVKAAIEGEEAPLILACSNNNQAVTNIIDSFINSRSTTEGLSKRWIPNFHGYATYLPSNSKSEKKLSEINYLKGNLFGYEGSLCELENKEYLINAEYYFLEKYNTYFGYKETSLEEACYQLQQELINIETNLINATRFSNDYISSMEFINNVLLDSSNHISNENINITKLHQWRSLLNELKTEYKKEEFINKIKVHFTFEKNSNNSKHIFKIPQNKLVNKDTVLSYVKQLLANINLLLQANLKLSNWKKENSIEGLPLISEDRMWHYELQKKTKDNQLKGYFYNEIDLTLRHKAFLLATHYWEARWILETIDTIENNTEKGTGEIAIKKQWKRRSMLTPCFVATFYMAPSHFVRSQFQGESEEGKAIFEYFPLTNFIDLLIIDEAGQVTPEVSIPLFALAKKAFVIGDLKQIEPIWSIPPKIDTGNLSSLNIIESSQENELLDKLGFLASSGSIMKMAQNACEYETIINDKKENGLILLEHRRCNDEIINFCNELAYNGILKPMKGKAKADQIFPSMLAYHVEGVSEKKYNSRFNIKEVNTIILWLQQNKESIQKAYNVNSIENILGIITPFASQKSELSKALVNAGYNINDVKIGTVHALQGAERSIILFSSVYSSKDEGTMFFDRDNKPNMLNVAVSRAKDSFILFGDTQIFNEMNKTPSGLLKKHLNIREIEY
ncbi:AAA domain-containing protein [Tenacibaculum sp. C7A-26P2]|uniref:DEAD/DEAH box helicase n=1 Tax=Tenacibaculum sp. C7A-26P2 TaxID=3447504 RepID=UPI003F86FBAD